METQQEKQWRENPGNWVWGMFYYNKEDDRVFLPKKDPDWGITINFANPKSFLALFAMVAFFGFVIYMIETHNVN